MSSHPEAADRTLIARVEQRDSDALADLYDRHSPHLMGVAARILGDTGEAEEVLQDVFLYVWRNAGSFDGTRGTVIAWLIVATRSRAIDRLRTRRPAARNLDEVTEPASLVNVEADSATREWESLCRAAIAELPPDQHRALELAFFEGLTHQEIAERTATPLGTVKTRVRLGLMKLRERVRPYSKSRSHGA